MWHEILMGSFCFVVPTSPSNVWKIIVNTMCHVCMTHGGHSFGLKSPNMWLKKREIIGAHKD